MEELFKLIELDEGFRARPYDDATGKPVKAPQGYITLGIGFNIEQTDLPREVAIYWLNFIIQRDFLPALRKIFPKYDSFTQSRKNALCSMIYQLGETRFRKFKNTIALVNAGNWADAAKEASSSVWAAQVPNRAKRLTLLIQNG